MSTTVKNSLINIVTWILVLAFFFPVFWMFINGFKPESVASSVNPVLFFTPTTEGYELAMDRGMMDYLRNSFIAATVATIICVLLAIPAAYALSLRRVKAVENALSLLRGALGRVDGIVLNRRVFEIPTRVWSRLSRWLGVH